MLRLIYASHAQLIEDGEYPLSLCSLAGMNTGNIKIGSISIGPVTDNTFRQFTSLNDCLDFLTALVSGNALLGGYCRVSSTNQIYYSNPKDYSNGSITFTNAGRRHTAGFNDRHN